MTLRPKLQKVVFSGEPRDVLLDAVRTVVPNASIVVATEESLPTEMADAQLFIGGKLGEETFASARNLAWHHVPFAGVESIVSPRYIERGALLTNSRGISAPNMSEHIIAMMLAFGRAIPFFVRNQPAHHWKPWEEQPRFFELTGQTVVLLGTGAIGKAVAERLRPFGCRIIGARRRTESLDGFDQIVSFADLGEILPEADHIVSTLPMTPWTEKLLSANLIGQVKQGAYFFNVGRGGTVDQDALIVALQNGQFGGAGLDVTNPEPLPTESPLWDMPNVLITCHTSGGSPMVGDRVAALFKENLQRYLDGNDLLNVIDFEHGY